MEADRVRRATTRYEHRPLGPRLLRARRQPQDEHVDAGVGGEQVGAEPDDGDPEALAPARPSERLLQLGERPRLGERARRPAGADRRQPRERDAFLDGTRHAGSPSTIARAIFHGSPTPNVITRSPGPGPGERERSRIVERRRPARANVRRQRVDDELAADAVARRIAARR